jgi:2-amino-4-hydroxy-6-hydroxymethyldihydropteridine diphosphokinase
MVRKKPEMMHTIHLGLGTNVGDRQANLRAAVAALPPDVRVLAQSRIYETPAWGVEDQPAFLNMALKGETAFAPDQLLQYLKTLEAQLGRVATYRWGPRVIDIDILFYDDLVMESPGLVIPHPGIAERAFVLLPLAEIAAQEMHPVLERSVEELLAAIDASGIEPA